MNKGFTSSRDSHARTAWAGQPSGTTVPLYSAHFPVDASTGYAVGSFGTTLKTTDGGAAWTSQASGTTNGLFSVCFAADAQTGYAVGEVGTILKTTDGGAAWTSQASGTMSWLWSVHFPQSSLSGYAVGSGGTFLKTTDGGATWVPFFSGTRYGLFKVYFPADAQTGYVVGGSGTILKTTDGGVVWVEEERSDGRGRGSEGRFTAAPNPFSKVIRVTYQFPSPGPVRLSVYNISGQLVKVLASGPRQAGIHQTAWDGRDESGRRLPSGIYLVHLEARSYRALRQVVLVR